MMPATEVEVLRLSGGGLLVQIGSFHVVTTPHSATELARMLHEVAHGEPVASGSIVDLHANEATA